MALSPGARPSPAVAFLVATPAVGGGVRACPWAGSRVTTVTAARSVSRIAVRGRAARRTAPTAAFVEPSAAVAAATAASAAAAAAGHLGLDLPAASLWLSDAAVDVTAAVEEVAKKPGLFDQLVTLVEQSLCGIHDMLAAAHVPGAYGLAIIGFTLAVKVVTFPLNYKQMESSMKMQALQPRMKAIQGEFRDNPQMANQAIAQLYKDEKINPLAGLLPVFAQIPIFISLYRALLNLAKENQLDEAFLFLPSLQGPVSQPGATLKDWLFPFVNGTPPIGWHDAAAYLVIPISLVALQVVSQKLLQPPSQDEAAQKANGFLKFLPLLIGWFSLNVPSGLGVYWVTNTAFSTLQTLAIRKKFDAEAVTVGAAGGGGSGAIGGAQEKGGVATRIVSKADGFSSSSSNGASSPSVEGGSGVQTTVRKAKKPGQKRRRK